MSQTFKAMTFNIKVGVDSHPASLAADLLACDPDLCSIQEVGEGWQMGVPISQTRYLAASINASNSLYAPALHDSIGGQFGVGLISKQALCFQAQILLPKDQDEQRTLLIATVDSLIPNQPQPLTLFITHLSIFEPERLIQAQMIASYARKVEGPLLLLGDLNDHPQSATLNALYETGLTDPWSTLGQGDGLTFSVKDPNRRIDYILQQGLHCHKIMVDTERHSSDHFPLIAELSFT